MYTLSRAHKFEKVVLAVVAGPEYILFFFDDTQAYSV
jgi:hypothetical protein